MSSEQTWLSKKLSPIIEDYSVVDVVMIVGGLLTIAALFTPLLHPLMGVAIGWGTYATAKAYGFYDEDRTPLKNGLYTEIDESVAKHCNDCGEQYHEKTGYKMMFILGYEIFRVEEFHSNECEECELHESPEEQEEDDETVNKVLA